LNDRLHVVWAQNQTLYDPWNPEGSSTGIRFKLHYFLWLERMYQIVRKLVVSECIDVVHHVGLMTVSAPSKLWRLPVPLVWGPLGGGQMAPSAFREYLGEDWHKERMRQIRIQIVERSKSLRRAVRGTRYLLTANRETEALVLRAGADRSRVEMMADNGLRPEAIKTQPRMHREKNVLTILWAGRLESRKCLPILIDALSVLNQSPSYMDSSAPRVHVLVAGAGPKLAGWKQRANERGVMEQITFLGFVPPLKMPDLFDQSDLFVFTSVQDTGGSAVLEALSHALPVMVLNHHGCADVIDNDSIIKIPVVSPDDTVSKLALELEAICHQPDRLNVLSEKSLQAARKFAWPDRARIATEIYTRILAESA
jgi:glycosyltransferase involved in cell wall biosynthesis